VITVLNPQALSFERARSAGADRGAEEEVDPNDVEPETRVVIARRIDVVFDLEVSTSLRAPLAVGVDTSSWTSGVLVVCLHTKNAWADPVKTVLGVHVYRIELDAEDPKQVFLGGLIAAIGVLDTSQVGASFFSTFSTPIGASVMVELVLGQSGAPSTGPNTASISIELLGRTGQAYPSDDEDD